MRHLFDHDGDDHEVGLTRPGDQYCMLLGKQAVFVSLTPLGRHRYALSVDDEVVEVMLVVEGDRVHLHCDGTVHTLAYTEPARRYAGGTGGTAEDVASAPMPGTLVALNVEPGQAVLRGQTLLVIESMKLETAIKAWRDGIVEAVHVTLGATFERGSKLVSLSPEPSGP